MANAETTQIDLTYYDTEFQIGHTAGVTEIESRRYEIDMNTDSILMPDYWTKLDERTVLVATRHAHNVVDELLQALRRRHDDVS